MTSPRGPVGQLRSCRQPLDHSRIDRLLKNNYVGRGGNDRLGQCLLPTATAKTDVVAQQLERHAPSPDGTTT